MVIIIIGLVHQIQKCSQIKIKSENEIIEFLIPKDMVATSSVRLFVLWTTLRLYVNYNCYNIFKNQTKPLVELAKTRRFEGDYVNDFRPSGT